MALPSPLNVTLGEFLNGSPNFGQGEKREEARMSVEGALKSEFGTI